MHKKKTNQSKTAAANVMNLINVVIYISFSLSLIQSKTFFLVDLIYFVHKRIFTVCKQQTYQFFYHRQSNAQYGAQSEGMQKVNAENVGNM